MRLAILTDDYLPTSTLVHAKMLHELALEFIKNGHKPTVITPGSPSQKTKLVIESIDGVTVWRFRSGKTRGVSKVVRAINETLLSLKAWRAIKGKQQIKTFDGVVYYSPSIFFGGLVRKIKAKSHCFSYLILRDLFPQWAIDEKLIKPGSLVERYFRFFESINYSAANTIGLMSPKNLELFNQIHKNCHNTQILFNWADTRRPEFDSKELDLRHSLGLEEKIIFFYGGNIGHAQDMSNLMRLAVSLKTYQNIHFLFIGQGDEVGLVMGYIEKNQLDNVTFLPSISQEDFKRVLRQVDIGLFSLAYSHTAHNFPGKLLGYMVESLPILGSVNPGNDLLDLLNSSGAGYAFINGEDEKLQSAAIELARCPENRKIKGYGANKLLNDIFSVESAASIISLNLNNKS